MYMPQLFEFGIEKNEKIIKDNIGKCVDRRMVDLFYEFMGDMQISLGRGRRYVKLEFFKKDEKFHIRYPSNLSFTNSIYLEENKIVIHQQISNQEFSDNYYLSNSPYKFTEIYFSKDGPNTLCTIPIAAKILTK